MHELIKAHTLQIFTVRSNSIAYGIPNRLQLATERHDYEADVSGFSHDLILSL